MGILPARFRGEATPIRRSYSANREQQKGPAIRRAF
jgi:hypothetical protein